MDDDQRRLGPWGESPPAHEPLFNAPWPALVVVAVIIGSYAWQVFLGGGDLAIKALGLVPADLEKGRFVGLVGMMFVHGGWMHATMNALAALTFGPPVARLLGEDLKGVLAFLALYLVCGVIAGLGYAVLHLHDTAPAIGASGAVSGLIGAAMRLLGGGEKPAPLLSRTVLNLAGGWIAVNLLLAVTGVSVLGESGKVAWEAHIAGLLAGLLLIGPLARLLGVRSSR